MNVRNCRKCGKIFNYVVGPHLCPACRAALEEDFQRVKEYIRSNPGATVTQVAEECDVEVGQIQQWLREERLEIAEGSAITLHCESCGAAIKSGRYCDKCRRELAMGLAGSVRENTAAKAPSVSEDKRDNGRMRYLTK